MQRVKHEHTVFLTPLNAQGEKSSHIPRKGKRNQERNKAVLSQEN